MEGSYGTIHEAISIATKCKWIMKMVAKLSMNNSIDVCLLKHEIAILKRLRHDNIIHLQEVIETPGCYYVIMEVCNGDLTDLLHERGALYHSEGDARYIIGQLVNALSYLHSKSIIHRDIKLENVLLGKNPRDPKDRNFIKLSDFGLALSHGQSCQESEYAVDYCGMPMYLSPEVIVKGVYSQQADMWAAGVIAYILLSATPPFKAATKEELFWLIRAGDVNFSVPVTWHSVSDGAKSCIGCMLTVDPASRVTAHDLMQHSWLCSIISQDTHRTGSSSSSTIKLSSAKSYEANDTPSTTQLDISLSELSVSENQSNHQQQLDSQSKSDNVEDVVCLNRSSSSKTCKPSATTVAPNITATQSCVSTERVGNSSARRRNKKLSKSTLPPSKSKSEKCAPTMSARNAKSQCSSSSRSDEQFLPKRLVSKAWPPKSPTNDQVGSQSAESRKSQRQSEGKRCISSFRSKAQ